MINCLLSPSSKSKPSDCPWRLVSCFLDSASHHLIRMLPVQSLRPSETVLVTSSSSSIIPSTQTQEFVLDDVTNHGRSTEPSTRLAVMALIFSVSLFGMLLPVPYFAP